MDELSTLLLGMLILCVVLTAIMMIGLHLFFKNYGKRLYEWYVDAIDKKLFRVLNIIILLALMFGFWYGIYRLIF